MADSSSVDACLNSEIRSTVEIKLIKEQLCWGDLAWKGNKGIPKRIPLREAKIGQSSPRGQRKCFKDTQKHFKTTKMC